MYGILFLTIMIYFPMAASISSIASMSWSVWDFLVFLGLPCRPCTVLLLVNFPVRFVTDVDILLTNPFPSAPDTELDLFLKQVLDRDKVF